jgi:hypothetical protein
MSERMTSVRSQERADRAAFNTYHHEKAGEL